MHIYKLSAIQFAADDDCDRQILYVIIGYYGNAGGLSCYVVHVALTLVLATPCGMLHTQQMGHYLFAFV